MMPKVLIVDDEISLCSLLEVFFQKKGFAVASAHNLHDAEQLLKEYAPDLAFVDLSLGQDSGLDLVRILASRFPELPVVVMTAYGTIEKAVEAIKLGAYDFLSKPFDMVLLAKVVEKAVSTRTLRAENSELKKALKGSANIELVGNSDEMIKLRGKIDTLASSDSTVLITGESGTGKEMVAKLIHHKSRRMDKPFVVVNCGALSENLLESELFGHMKGAFTSAHAEKEGLFTVADKGILFLDEIGEMPLHTQVKLLRVLQEREVTPVGGTQAFRIDVRVLAATNVELEQAVGAGRFREDLYYRLNVLRIHMPSLAERGDDSVFLARHFLEKKSKGLKTFSPEVLSRIAAYHWPGNVRQLENAVERAIAYSSNGYIDTIELDAPRSPTPESLRSVASPAKKDECDGSSLSGAPPDIQEIEKAYIHWILSQNQWHKPTAAKILGLDISTLYRKIEKYGLKP